MSCCGHESYTCASDWLSGGYTTCPSETLCFASSCLRATAPSAFSRSDKVATPASTFTLSADANGHKQELLEGSLRMRSASLWTLVDRHTRPHYFEDYTLHMNGSSSRTFGSCNLLQISKSACFCRPENDATAASWGSVLQCKGHCHEPSSIYCKQGVYNMWKCKLYRYLDGYELHWLMTYKDLWSLSYTIHWFHSFRLVFKQPFRERRHAIITLLV